MEWENTQITEYAGVFEKIISPIFVRNSLLQFATVSTTIIVIDSKGKGTFYESCFKHE